MKRKIVWVAGPVLLACLLFALHWRWAAVCCGAVWLGLAALGRVRRWPWPLGMALLSYVLALGYSWGYTALRVEPVRQLDGQSQVVWASVRETPVRYEDSQRALLHMRVDTGRGERTVKTYAYLPLGLSLSAGDRVRGEFSFYLPQVQDGFERQEYYLSQGVPILASCRQVLETEQSTPLWSYPQRAARAVQRAVSQLYEGDAAALMNGLLLGDTSGMSQEMSLAFQRAGLTHLVAVSGMHVSVLVGALCLFLGRKYGSILSLFLVFFVAGMTGAPPSILRAVIMYVLMCAAWLLGREVDSLSSLCAALLVLLAANPYAVQSVSLQLSFAATAGILLWGRQLTGWLERRFPERLRGRVLHAAAAAAACSITASALTFPLLLWHFGWTTITAPITNVLVLWVINPVFIAGAISCPLYFLFPPVARLLAAVVTVAEEYVLFCARLFAAIPMQTVYADQVGTWLFVLLVAAVMVAAAAFRERGRRLRWLIPAGSLAAALALLTGVVAGERESRAVSLPTGWGQSILVRDADRVLAIDCGASGHRDGAELVEEWMAQQREEEIDLLVLTAVDLTHARHVPQLLERVPVRSLVLPEQVHNEELRDTILQLAREQGTERLSPAQAEEYLPGLRLDGSVATKLTVEYEGDGVGFLTLHSLTANMALEWMQSAEVPSGAICVLSPNLWEEPEKMAQLVQHLAPRCLLFPSDRSLPEEFDGIPCRNSMDEGELPLTP